MLDPGPGEVPAAATAPPLTLPEILDQPFQQTLILEMETSGQSSQDSATAGPLRLYPPLLVSTDEKGEGNTGIRQRLCPTKEQEDKTPLQRPLGEAQQPPVQDTDGHYHQPPVAYYYQPFSSTDMLNWQRHTPPYLGSDKP